MCSATDGVLRVGVEVGEGGEFFARLLIWQRIREDGVFGQLGEADVAGHVVDVGAVVLPHEEELARIAEDSGADAAFFEAAVLLNDGDVPAVELAHLRVALLHDLFAARDVQQPRDFFIDVPLPQPARHRDDVLARVVRDEESGHGAKQLGGFGNVAQLEVRDLAGERDVAWTVEQATVVAVGAPRQKASREVCGGRVGTVELNQFLKHAMGRVFVGPEGKRRRDCALRAACSALSRSATLHLP